MITSLFQCLHQLIDTMNFKKSESKTKRVKKEVTTLEKPEMTTPAFVWISEHQVAFDTLNMA